MKKKLLSLFLSLCMVMSFLSIGAMAAGNDFSDMPAEDYWAHDALTAAVDNGLLKGDGGRLLPQGILTRAQMAVILNRAFGAQDTADISGYTDVPASAWYYTDIAKAVRMGTFQGSGGTMCPMSPVTRQEAFTALARAIKLTVSNTSALDAFTDKADISSWAASALAAMVEAGYVQGSSGKLNPTATMTREEFAQVMHNTFASYLSASGTYTESITGNVIVSTDDVTLKGLTVTGDLIIGEGAGNGDITLDGVTVKGRLVVRGGGENSIHITNSSDVGSIIVGKTGDGGVRVRTEEGCRVEVVYVDDGLDDVILEGSFNQVSVETDAPVVLKDATVTGLTVSGASADVKLSGTTTVAVTQIAAEATGAKLEVGTGAQVAKVESAAESVKITGSGKVTQAVVSGSNTAVDVTGAKVTTEKGVTGVTQNGTAVTSTITTTAPTSGGSSDPGIYNASAATLAQLQTALSDGSAAAVSITGTIPIPSGTTVTLNKPVTVAAQAGAELSVSGALINNSTLTCANRDALGDGEDTGLVVEPGGSFTNNSIFVNNCRLGMFEASFTNTGTVTNNEWFHCGGSALVNSGTFNCPGELTLLNSDELSGSDNIFSAFTNSAGGTFNTTADGSVLVGTSCTFTNSGNVSSGGVFENYGTINSGTIDTSTGSFTYADYVLNAGTVNGILTAGSANALRENFKPVSTLSGLTDSLSSLEAGYAGIAIVGNLTLTNNLTIDQYVLIAYCGSLTVPSGKTLTVSYTSEPCNELKVAGTLSLAGGSTLVTAVTGTGDSARMGQVTIVGGTLAATGSYTITNNGAILFIRGTNPAFTVTTGNPIAYIPCSITTEAELRAAMADETVHQIYIDASLTLTSSLDVTKYTLLSANESSPYTLNISSPATLTIKDGAEFVIMGNVVNNGTFTGAATAATTFLGSYASFVNNSILNVNNTFYIFEGTLVNNTGDGNINIGSSGQMLVTGGILTNNALATFLNKGNLTLWNSTGEYGAVRSQAPSVTNAGTFCNGPISLPASDAYFGMTDGTLTNTGSFVNNGQINLSYVDVTNAGTFDTYNSSGTVLTGGSLNTTASSSFHNEGYMKVIDEYYDNEAVSSTNKICDITLGTGTFENGSNWLDYTAAVYSDDGLAAAENAQTIKLSAPSGLFSAYNRMDIMDDITISADKTFSDFEMYWVESQWNWNDTLGINEETKATLTIDGGTLTIGQTCTLHIDTGIVDNNGTVVTAAATGSGDTYVDCGLVDVWNCGEFNNTDGTVTNNGEFIVRSNYNTAGAIAQTGTVTTVAGHEISNVEHLAMVYSEVGLRAAVASADPAFVRIEIKGDSIITLTSSNLTLGTNLYIEPGSGLIVNHGVTLILDSGCCVNNDGDVSVYGAMTIGSGAEFFNNASLEIGVSNSSETAQVTVSSGGVLYNNESLTVFPTGTLDASAGTIGGSVPPSDSGGGTYVPPTGL